MRNSIFYFFFLVFSFTSFSQKKNIETKFYRPSLSNVYIFRGSTENQKIIKRISQIPLLSRFDDHSLSNNFIDQNNNNQINKSDLKTFLITKYSKQIIAKWFSQDQNGNMSDKLINQRGEFSATDKDVNESIGTEIERIQQIGYDLINKTYLIVFDVTSVKSMNEVYNEKDAKRKKAAALLNTTYTPVERSEEGYEIDYSARVFKLLWNDSISSLFYSKNFLDFKTTENRSEIRKSFENSSYPLQYIDEVTGFLSSTQSNKNESYVFNKRKSLDELLNDAALKIHDEVFYKFSKKIDDFRVKVALKSDYPTLAKIGSKEGIYMGQKFNVYFKKGDEIKRKKGVVRVKRIVNNNIVADGQMPSSRFFQVGGRKIKGYYFLESKEDRGSSLSFYKSFNDSSASGGYGFSFDKRLDHIFKLYSTDGSGRIIRNFNIGFNLTANPFNKEYISRTDDSNFDTSSFVGSTFNFGFNFGREVYLNRRGNFYLFPEIGLNLLGYYFNQINNELIELKRPESIFINYGINYGIGLGVNITPSVSIIAKYQYYLRLSDFKNVNKTEDGSELILSENNYFKNINNLSNPFYIGLRIKF
jgi:hypothetical protein